jgi:hypothetical protein
MGDPGAGGVTAHEKEIEAMTKVAIMAMKNVFFILLRTL